MPRRKKQPATTKNTPNPPAMPDIVFYQYMSNSFSIIDLNIEACDLSSQETPSTVNQVENIVEKLVDDDKKLHWSIEMEKCLLTELLACQQDGL